MRNCKDKEEKFAPCDKCGQPTKHSHAVAEKRHKARSVVLCRECYEPIRLWLQQTPDARLLSNAEPARWMRAQRVAWRLLQSWNDMHPMDDE